MLREGCGSEGILITLALGFFGGAVTALRSWWGLSSKGLLGVADKLPQDPRQTKRRSIPQAEPDSNAADSQGPWEGIPH